SWPLYSTQLNMANATTPTGTAPAEMSVFSRFIGIITSPRDTFASVVAQPKWLVMYLLTTVIVAIFSALPMTTEAGQQAVVEQQVSSMEAFGMEVNDQMYEQLRARAGTAAYTTAG